MSAVSEALREKINLKLGQSNARLALWFSASVILFLFLEIDKNAAQDVCVSTNVWPI